VNWGFGEVLWFRRATGDVADRLKAQAARQTRCSRIGSPNGWAGRPGSAATASAGRTRRRRRMVNRSVHYGLGPPAGGPLARWHARCGSGPSVAETFAEFDAAAARGGGGPRRTPRRGGGSTATTGWSGW
jgi:RNA polymerase-associated protein